MHFDMEDTFANQHHTDLPIPISFQHATLRHVFQPIIHW